MPKIFELLDSLEGIGRDELVAEIEVCRRRIAWCEVFIKMIDEGTPAKPLEKDKKSKKFETYNGKQTLWAKARDYIEEHGGGRWPTNYLAQCLCVDPSRLHKALSQNPKIFERVDKQWMLKLENTDDCTRDNDQGEVRELHGPSVA